VEALSMVNISSASEMVYGTLGEFLIREEETN
jgi:hypothetical protein